MAPRSSPAIGGGGGGRVAVDLYPFLRVYEGGHIERLVRSTAAVAASHDDGTATSAAVRPATRDGVATRDVVVDEDTGASARLFLPGGGGEGRRLPLVLYFHGGAFVTGSAFGRLFHRYAASLAARAGALVVSVEYRLAPEHPLPEAFADGWAALRLDALWPYVTGGAAGNDDPRIDPPAEDVSSLPCRRALVAVAEKDVLSERGRRYAAQLRGGGREVTLVESEGEDHCFHLYRPARPSAVELMDRVAQFISPASSCLQAEELHLHGRRRTLCHGNATAAAATRSGAPRRQLVVSGGPTTAKLGRPKTKVCGGPACKAQTALCLGPRGMGKAQRHGFVGMGGPMPSGTNKYSVSSAALRVLC
uniref:Alpha/beta hydrolase fold-3 domain-containing protein n=1 Tax=Oryza glumipatula TaxID=40148 RepID=A0A0E0AK89_9ORYZ